MPDHNEAHVRVHTRYLSVAQAAKILAVDPRTVRREVESGRLPALRLGRRGLIRIHPDDLPRIGDAPRGESPEVAE